MTSEREINININKNNDNIDSNIYNEFKDYIIQNNIILQKENKDYLKQLSDRDQSLLEKEEEIDKFDTRIRYLKGLLQNMNELKKYYKELTKNIEQKQKIVQELHNKNKKNFTDIYKLLLLTNITTFILPFYYINCYVLIIQTFYIIGILFTISRVKQKYLDIKLITQEKTINFTNLSNDIDKYKKAIINIEESNISLDNWICEI